jgi:multidrug efflux pump subunit AcrA (membrane-fusion protein)
MVHLAGCSSSKTTASSEPIPVQVRQARLIEQPVSVLAGGDVESYSSAMVAFEVSGRVKRVYVEEGQHVVKGQLLAEINSTDYQHGVEAARGAADSARATEEKAQNGLRPQELEQARLALEQSQDEYQRMKFLHDRKSLNANDFHKFETAYLTARQNYEMAKQGARTEDIKAAQGQAHATAAQLQDAKSHLGKCRLVAPLTGFIGMRHINAGDMASAGTPVFSVLDLERVKARVAVPEAEVGKIRVGTAADVTIPALAGEKFTGRVETLGVSADSLARTYAATVVVENPDHRLRDGMVGQARIFGDGKIQALTLPVNAVVRDARGISNVYVYDASRRMVFARRVEAGNFLGSEIEIRSGISAKDEIVVAGEQMLHEGSLVVIAGGSR